MLFEREEQMTLSFKVAKVVDIGFTLKTEAHPTTGVALSFMLISGMATITGVGAGLLLHLAAAPGWLVGVAGLSIMIISGTAGMWWARS
ncbi:hypothetical protein [Nonomuraea endophytica]|uniref:hypothetical protein n=1 Tax=Nonomuraea endophytica TaxID=714136 RepID=UPI0037C93735